MKNSIIFSFIFIGIYAGVAIANWDPMVILLFSLSPLMVIYVVYKVLKDPKEVEVTFEDHFYQDSKKPRVK